MATRRSNKRTRRNRGRFGFLYQIVSFLLILVVVVAGCAVFFRVEEITVSGQGRYTAQEIIDAAGVEVGDNLFAPNQLRAARRQIRTALPYVDDVNIRRVLPNGLALTVTECVPALLVRGGTSWWVVDGKGKLLEEVKTAAVPGLARVEGLTTLLPVAGTRLAVDPLEDAKLETLLQLAAAFTQRGMMERVSQIDLTGNVRLTLTYDERFTVVLPLVSDTAYTWEARALQSTVEEELQPNDTGKIDMTHMEETKQTIIFSPS